MRLHRLPDHDDLTTAITDHLETMMRLEDRIEHEQVPGTPDLDVLGRDHHEQAEGQVTIRVGGRVFCFELWEIL